MRGGAVDGRYEELLRRLAVLDDRTIASALPMRAGVEPELDARTTALVRLAAFVALQSSPQTCAWGVAAALDMGCSEVEVVAVLAVLAPVVGTVRISSAAL